MDLKTKEINLYDNLIKLLIWDTVGQERFRRITRTYYKNCDGLILVFDLKDESSFKNIPNWFEDFEKSCAKDVYKILVGNKKDSKERKITEEEANKLAKDFNVPYFETSAKDNTNIKETFDFIIKEILKKNII